MGFTSHVRKAKYLTIHLTICFELLKHVQSAQTAKRTQSQCYPNKTYLAANFGSITKRDNFKKFSLKLKPPLFIFPHRSEST